MHRRYPARSASKARTGMGRRGIPFLPATRATADLRRAAWTAAATTSVRRSCFDLDRESTVLRDPDMGIPGSPAFRDAVEDLPRQLWKQRVGEDRIDSARPGFRFTRAGGNG